MICGQKEENIRKAYFKGKIPKLLTDIQASGDFSVEEYSKLKDFLQQLKERDERINNNFIQFIPKIEEEDSNSILDELNQETLSEAEIKDLEREKSNRENSVIIASKLLRGLFNAFYDPSKKTPSDEELMNLAFEMLSLEYYLIRDSLYKERLYRKKIVEYERGGKQRKTAEEYAKGGIEYRNWMLAENLRESSRELINLAKKKYKNL